MEAPPTVLIGPPATVTEEIAGGTYEVRRAEAALMKPPIETRHIRSRPTPAGTVHVMAEPGVETAHPVAVNSEPVTGPYVTVGTCCTPATAARRTPERPNPVPVIVTVEPVVAKSTSERAA